MSNLPYAEVIGDPVSRSKSPVIHNFWLDQLGIEAEYRKTHVTRDGLAAYFLSRRADPDWLGCNVTIPHKVAAMDHVEDPGDVRGRIGAMNTVACETGGPLIGTNTDAGGFLQPLDAIGWQGSDAVLIGAGGAALAVGFALAARGVSHLTVMARDADKGRAFLAKTGIRGDVIGFGAPLPATQLVVNCSPLGMTGQPPLSIDLSPLPDTAVVYDIVYAPLETDLLRAARARGLPVIDGLAMLIGQAALAFEIFFDAQPPRGDGDAALRERLDGSGGGVRIIGLTGSIGMGKSAVASMLRQLHVPVFDADAAVHRLQGPDGALLPAIEARFPGTTGPGGVDRQKLGAMVLGDSQALRALEKIVHPAVGAMRARFLRRHRSRKLVVLDVPLLFETGGQRRRGREALAAILVVSAPPVVQRHRVLRRVGMTGRKFRQILARQVPDHRKRAMADHVIETARPKWQTLSAVRRVLPCLRSARVR